MRSMCAWYSGFTRKRQPEATGVSSIERSCHSPFSSSSTLRMLSASTSPPKRRFSCCTVSGSGEDSSAASSTRLTCSRSIDAGTRASEAGVSTASAASTGASCSGGSSSSGLVCSVMSDDRERLALAPQLHVDRVEGGLLGDLDERLARELEHGEEAHHQQRHAPLGLEEARE